MGKDAVSDFDLNLLHTMLDRGGGSVDIEELIVFLQVDSSNAAATIARMRKAPVLQTCPRTWGVEDWHALQESSGGAPTRSLPARKRRNLEQDSLALAAARSVSAHLERRHGSLASACVAMDVFKERCISMPDLEAFVQLDDA